jgi:exopolysaccharide biosynthesis polyprenyl glycosylphosphotransferase
MSRKLEDVVATNSVVEKRLKPRTLATDETGPPRPTSLGCDLVAMLLGLSLAAIPWNLFGDPIRHPLLAIPAYTMVFLVAFGVCGVYQRDQRRLSNATWRDVGVFLLALLVGACTMFVLSHLLFNTVGLGSPLTTSTVVVLTVPLLLTVPACRFSRSLLHARSGKSASRVVILGSGKVAESLASRLRRLPEFQLVGFVDESSGFGPPSDIHRLGSIDELPAVCNRNAIDRILVAYSYASEPDVLPALRQLPRTVQVSIVPRFFDLITWRSEVSDLDGLAVIDIAPASLGRIQRAAKRTIDVVCASFALIVLSPFAATIAVLIKVSSPGPVFFRQLRTGRNGEPFSIYKFRTMREGADDDQSALRAQNEVDGPIFKIRNDPRITRVGSFLRKTSLDELPQLLNVLRGEMSLVGPRPFPVSESDQITGWAARRFDVRPGMTGLWQVSGRNDLSFDELERLDYGYVASWSFAWDLKILLQTPRCVLQQKGAY